MVSGNKLHSIRQSPREPKFFQNPFPFYSELRNLGSVVRWADYEMPVSCDYSLVNKILRDKRFVREPINGFFSNTPAFLQPFYENESRSILEREPPYHTRLKSAVLPFFTKKKLKVLESEIRGLCLDLLKDIPSKKFNIIESFSKKFPVIVICRLVGVPESMAAQLVTWSNKMVAMYQARRNRTIEKQAVLATTSFSHYLTDLVQVKKKSNDHDLISYLVKNNESTKLLTTPEIVSTIILLLNAGHEATVHTISNGIKAMIESKFTLKELGKNPQKLSAEILRFSTPLHMFIRYSSIDMRLDNVRFKKGDKIGLLLAAANRDPKHFVSPEEFNPFIPRKPNLSLGAGLHFCLGAHLARLELEIAMPILIEKFPKMNFAEPPQYEDNFHFYGLKELLLEF